jgi:acyl-CoA synthetase (AMP-forming)/AMP-acid ligase II
MQATAIHHVTADSQTICLSYRDFADRARGLAYYLRKCGHKHVGTLCPNTPASIISIFGIAAAGAVNTTANCQLNADEVAHVFEHSEVDAVIVDWEFVGRLERFRENHPNVKLIVDEDNERSGQFYDAINEGLQYDMQTGRNGWDGLEAQPVDENSLIAVAYTSGTTAKPKGAEYTHRGAYLAAMGNIIES